MTRSGPQPDQFPRKFGKYHLLAPLAQGGMGALYLAVTGERGLEKLLVIKTVLPHLADSEYLARFRDEAKVVVKLSHGNLIPVFDAGQVDGELFLAMDFVEGKDLRAVWNRCAHKGVAFPVDVAVFLVKELCRGLGYAHAFGDLRLVHRDVSPPNVLISYSGEVKLTDFGLASSTLKLEKTAPGIIYGKVSYMSPEQARGEPLDGRSDLYAAGIILWELLTGRQLFPPGKEQPQDLLKRARNPVAVPPSQRAPRVPPALDAICLKALAASRDDRFATGEELRDALGGWLAAESPATDAARIERFLHMLFAEDIERERAERQALIEKTRERVRATMPPTDELRRILERGGSPAEMAAAVAAADRRKEAGPNLGRRAPDVGEPHSDRRQQQGRRVIDKVLAPSGVAVDVPAPGPGGRTVVPGDSGAAAAAAADFEPSAETRRTDFLNEVIDGRYRIDELIGEGGMGRVYLAEHVEIGKRVAIKILHPVYGRMPDLVERFRREARAASKIGHPHIVDVTDSGTTVDGSVYFVMEYLEGVELASVIDREGALDVARALRITTQICRALAAAHAVGIIHRDLKPENVFLTVREGAADFVKVLDFGIAKSSEAEEARGKRLTHPGMAMGTPEYMSPEQAAGRPADERCDVYAVGAILYEMLTGAPPYDGDNFMEILTKKATVDPAPPSALRPEIPPMVEVLVTSAMARDPEKRPPSMEAFEYEVTKALSGRGAAVAKILGIQSEAALLANLGSPYMPRDEVTPVSAPGLAQGWRARIASGQMAQLARHEVTPQPSITGSPFPVGASVTHGPAVAVPVMAVDSGPSMASGPAMSPLMGSSPSMGMPMPTPVYAPEEVSESTELIRKGGPVPDVRGAGMRLFGWVILVLLLVAGGGAVFLALDSERSGAGKPGPAPGPAPAVTPEGSGGNLTAEPSRGSEGDRRGKPVERKEKGSAKSGDGKSSDGKSSRASKDDGKTSITDDLVPRTAKEAEALLKEAAGLRDKLKWDAARDRYELVVAGKFKRDQGYLGLAEVAFQHNRADDVIAYAKRAGTGVRARILLGHAHFKKKDYAAALKYYESVLKEEKGNVEAQNGAKAARDKLR